MRDGQRFAMKRTPSAHRDRFRFVHIQFQQRHSGEAMSAKERLGAERW